MNERIRLLAEQAEWSVRWGNPNNYEEYNRSLDEWQEKFAELLIRECLEQIDDGNSDHAGGNREAIDRIKEHFGVEQ